MLTFSNINLPDLPSQQELVDLQNHIKGQYSVLKDEWGRFKSYSNKLLEKVFSYFEELDSSDPSLIEEQLDLLSGYSFSIGECLSWSAYFLSLYEILHFCPKQSGVSEADRKQYVLIKTLEQTTQHSLIEQYEIKIDKRISILQSRLKSETEKAKFSYNNGNQSK